MEREYHEVSLDNLGNGAAVEMFNEAFRELVENIEDPNTEPDAKRMLVMKVTVKPNDQRDFAAVSIIVEKKLAQLAPFGAMIHIGNGKAFEGSAKEQNIPFNNIEKLGG